MKLNNKGFAISSMLYSILLLFLMLIVGVLAILGNRKVILDKMKNEIVTDLTKNSAYSFSFAHKDILLANTSKVSGFTFDLLDDVKIVDQNGNVIQTEIATTSSPTFDATKNGTYVITYRANYQGNIIEEERTIEVIAPIVYEYAYTGREQQFVAPTNGLYQMELWGAQGGSISGKAYNKDGSVRANNLTYKGGKGAYTKGNISLGIGTNLHIYVGGSTEENTSLVNGTGTPNGGYNGGTSLQAGQEKYGSPGGGATDIRLIGGNWDNFNGLKSRIIVAAGGGGANFRNQGYGEGNGGEGGTLTGIDGYEALVEGSYFRNDYPDGYQIGLGATQTMSGAPERHFLNGTIEKQAPNGAFGGLNAALKLQAGGGGGYYSGASSYHGGAGGGSSFISGMSGCNSISENATVDNLTHTDQANHYSGYVFENSTMKSGKEAMPTYDGTGTMVGNEGNGFAKITALIIDNAKVATNLIQNSGFETDSMEEWPYSTSLSPERVSSTSVSGLYSLKMNVVTSSTTNDQPWQIISTVAGHKYYGTAYTNTNVADPEKTLTRIVFSPETSWTWLQNSNSTSKNRGEWMRHSILYQNPNYERLKFRIALGANPSGMTIGDYYYIDNAMVLDLTEIYGAGNEPSKEWCDANIHYFDGVGIVPNY